jgi:serine/threonine protein kinase/formylglycine-generating enzyme required for sulfatase activity
VPRSRLAAILEGVLTFEDLHVAAILREKKHVSPADLARHCAALDGTPDSPGLAARLLEANLIDSEKARKVVATARRRVGLEADMVYIELAGTLCSLDNDALSRLLTETTVGGRIGSKLLEQGILTADQDAEVIATARAKIQEREKELLERERSRGFVEEERTAGSRSSGSQHFRKKTPALGLGMIAAEIEEQILAEPTVKVSSPKKVNPDSSGAIKAQEEAILAEPTLTLRKDELSEDDDSNETVKHRGVFPVPEKAAPAPERGTGEGSAVEAVSSDGESGDDLRNYKQTHEHAAVFPLPNQSSEDTIRKTGDKKPNGDDAPLEPSVASVALAEDPPPPPRAGGKSSRRSPETPASSLPRKTGKSKSPASLEGKTLRVLSGYEIEKEIGKGAMGVVYLAREAQLRRQVALKVLPPSDDDEALKRFGREARAIAALDHPGIVPIYQFGEADGHAFIAMKLIEGKPLREIAKNALPAKRAAALMEQVARAMAYAHGQGVIHRDLKPANILVEPGDKPWVVDFGIAKLDTEATLTQAGDIMGTPAYMSPEQALQLQVNHLTDVYSLGAVLYAITTGRSPFPGQNALEVLPLVAAEEPPQPHTLRKDIPPDLETIILVAMSKEPDRRYASAGELAEDLRRYQAGEPIQGKRPGAIYKLRRWAKRHRLAALALVLVVAAAGTAYALTSKSAVAKQQEQQEREKEERANLRKAKLVEFEANLGTARKSVDRADVVMEMVNKARELLAAADQVESGNAAVAEARGRLDAFAHEEGEKHRKAARELFMKASVDKARAELRVAADLEPQNPDNAALEKLFQKPAIELRWKTPGTQLAWARLDKELHVASDWQAPSETLADHATLAVAETQFVRLRALAPGRFDAVFDIELKPGTVVEVPALPKQSDETKDMVFIAPGAYVLGGRAMNPTRAQPGEVRLDGFLIEKTAVTRSAYLAFVRAGGYENEGLWSQYGLSWLKGRKKAGGWTAGPHECDLTVTARNGEPVVGVSFYEAEAYAKWKGRQLPNQDQLEAAARGQVGATYPWGNRFPRQGSGELFVVFGLETPKACGANVIDTTPQGCTDLAGNVREWTHEEKKSYANQASGQTRMLVKGASFGDSEKDALQLAKGASTTDRDPEDRKGDLGFRCIRLVKPEDY